MSNNRIKGFLKGLRYISQIFENEREPEMQIGLPTDVKHVAHIGSDGPSLNAPSWMNEFKSPFGLTEESNADSSVKSATKDSSRVRDSPGLPKSSKKSSSGSPKKEKSDKTRRRISNKETAEGSSSRSSRRSKEPSGQNGNSGSLHNSRPEIPKKVRRKKSKESSTGGGSSRSSRRARGSEIDQMSECMSETGSFISMSNYEDERRGF